MISDEEKNNDELRLKESLPKGDEVFSKTAHELFGKYKDDENFTGWIAGYAYEKQSNGCIPLIFKFCEQFPDSKHPVRVWAADIMRRNGHADECTEVCRQYLRQIQDTGNFPIRNDMPPILQFGIGKALTLLPSSMLKAGALNYSYRMLSYAHVHNKIPEVATHIKEIQQRIDDQLDDEEKDAIDRKWEEFFKKGLHKEFLIKHCTDLELPMLACRVDVMWGHIAFDKSHFAMENECFLLLREGEDEDGKKVIALL